MWLGTLIWFALRVSWRRYRNGGDRLIVKIGMPLFMLYIACRFSIYDASQRPPSGAVLRFDDKGNLIEIVSAAPPSDLATVERDSWRHEWCARPVFEVNEWLNYNDPASVQRFEDRRRQATIKCDNQRREWCANNPADPWEHHQNPGVLESHNRQREWCARHPTNR
jgi:hypothetical protein